MASNIITGASQHVERPWEWHVAYVKPGALTGTIDVTAMTLPAGTIILDVKTVTVVAASGVSTCKVDIEIGATGIGDTTALTGNTDGGSVRGDVESAVTDANLLTINAVSLGGSDLVVNMEVAYGGTETASPTIAVCVLCGRQSY